MQEVLCETDNYNKPHFKPRSKIVNGKCESDIPIEALFGMMSGQYERGFTILSVQFRNRKTFNVATVAQTEVGICATIVPALLFNSNYYGPNRYPLLRNLKSGTVGGKVNGVQLLVDTEAYDQGVDTSLALGAIFQVHL